MRRALVAAAPLAALALAAVFLRFWGIHWGLPHTYNADEPHVVNLALSFGGGSLRPYYFKYPTLWPYVLFFFYGLYFVLWSGFGLRRGVIDFIGLYGWEPTGFYLIGRILAAVFSLLALGWVWKAERETRGSQSPPWAALILAFSPMIVELAHTSKPDCLMLFFACAAWYFALRVLREGGRRALWACGLCVGLAVSCQYTAAPLALLVPLAYWLSPKPKRWTWVIEGAAAAAVGFLAGTPYALLDFPRFRENLSDFSELAALRELDRWRMTRQILGNIWGFGGGGSLAGLAAVAGLARLLARDHRRALLLGLPVAAYVVVLSGNTDGGWTRYLMGCFPALALLAAEGLAWADRPARPLWTALLGALILLPPAGASLRIGTEMRKPDTRVEAEAWIAANVPQGSILLLDLPHAGPRLAMAKEEVEELARKSAEAGSPRARLYRAMAATHPGGGYRIYRIQRSPRDLWSAPRHVQLSQADTPTLDVRPGLDPVRAGRVNYVVLSSMGAAPERSPELSSFFSELAAEGELVKEFAPRPGVETGPTLKVFRLKRRRA